MSNSQATLDADTVLLTFAASCPKATDDEVRAWSLRFPQFSVAIAEHAEAMRIAGPYVEGDVVELTPEQAVLAERQAEAMLNAAYGRTARQQPKVRPGSAAERSWGMER